MKSIHALSLAGLIAGTLALTAPVSAADYVIEHRWRSRFN